MRAYTKEAYIFVDKLVCVATNLTDSGSQRGEAVMAQLRVSKETHEKLRELARNEGISMQRILEKALTDYEKTQFFESLDAAFKALKADPVAWAQELEERRLWENTLMDGLDPNEIWTEDGNVIVKE